MIDIRISEQGRHLRFEASGNLKEVASDFAMAVSVLYGQIACRDSAKAAEAFKFLIQKAFSDESPVWGDDFGSLPTFYASGDMADIIRRAFERGAQRGAD